MVVHLIATFKKLTCQIILWALTSLHQFSMAHGGEWMFDEPIEWQEYFSIGVGSRQPNGKHCLFLDLDDYSKKQAEKVAQGVINDYAVSDCYIVKSSAGNHHLVSFDLMGFETVTKIGKDHAHGTWVKHRKKGRDYVLRITPKVEVTDGKIIGSGVKPKLVSIVKSPFNYRQKSNALRTVFQDAWGIRIQKDRYFDNSKEYKFHIYRMRFAKGNKGDKNAGAGK